MTGPAGKGEQGPVRPLLDRACAWPQYLLPHHALSLLVYGATRWRFRPWKDLLIRTAVRHYRIDIGEAAGRVPQDYPSFNAFFTRALKTGARPLAGDPAALLSPVDATLSQIGTLSGGRLVQAKGRDYDLRSLLGDAEATARLRDGAFATLYLSPRDYHRIHMPLAGRLLETRYVPGRLFSVAPCTVRSVPRLFARNERLVCLFETECGLLAVVLVGALFVACIETVWGGVVTPPHGHWIRVRRPDPGAAPRLQRGEELGRFNMGSTVILVAEPGRVQWREGLVPGCGVRMGEAIGRVS